MRTPISPTVRFKVLVRDDYACRYCGGRAPNVTLEVDHYKPVAEGGTNHIDNLVTACFTCNRGKRDKQIDPEVLAESALMEAVLLYRRIYGEIDYWTAPYKYDDYVRGWHFSLFLESLRPQYRGHLPNDKRALCKLAGCHSLNYFERYSAEMLTECFRVSDDGNYLYDQKVVDFITGFRRAS